MTLALGNLSPSRLGPAVRLFLGRRPWIRWLLVLLVAALLALAVHDRMRAVDGARARWAQRRTVPVATSSAVAGGTLAWEWREVPFVVVPDDVATDVTAGAVVRRDVGRGEIVVAADLTRATGPAASAEVGDVVVPIDDPLVNSPEVGLDVAVYSDGIVLAAAGRIVHVETAVVFVAVDAAAAPTVAAAAQARRASIVFLAPG